MKSVGLLHAERFVRNLEYNWEIENLRHVAAQHRKKWVRSCDPKLAASPLDVAVTVSSSISWKIRNLTIVKKNLRLVLGCLRCTLTGICGDGFF